MIFTGENILLVGSILLFVSILVGKTGYRFGVPALLLFLGVGMLFGSDGLGLQFHNAKEAQFIGMVSLSVILFSGGMDTKFTDIRPVLPQGLLLSTVGVLLTALFTGLFIWWLSGMSWTNIHFPLLTSLLLASTMSSTDSASVFAILRSQKINLKHNLRPMLELESGSNDPMAYMMTIVLIQLITSTSMSGAAIAGSFVVQFLVGGAAGYVLGKLAIQSTVSTLGTTAIAAQAMANVLEGVNSNAQIGIGLGMMTIVGQCMGANRLDEAKHYIKRLTGYSYVATFVACALTALAVKPVTVISGMEPAAAALTILPEALRQFSDYRMLVYAVVLILMMLLTNNKKMIGMLSAFREKLQKKEQNGGASA